MAKKLYTSTEVALPGEPSIVVSSSPPSKTNTIETRSLTLMRYGIEDSVAQLEGVPLVSRRTHQFDNPKGLTVRDRVHGYECGSSFQRNDNSARIRAAHRTNRSWIKG